MCENIKFPRAAYPYVRTADAARFKAEEARKEAKKSVKSRKRYIGTISFKTPTLRRRLKEMIWSSGGRFLAELLKKK